MLNWLLARPDILVWLPFPVIIGWWFSLRYLLHDTMAASFYALCALLCFDIIGILFFHSTMAWCALLVSGILGLGLSFYHFFVRGLFT
jgi:hypothetical protein